MRKSLLRCHYKTPEVLQQVTCQPESDLLAGSVKESLNNAGVFTSAQEVDYQDFSDASTNYFEWE